MFIIFTREIQPIARLIMESISVVKCLCDTLQVPIESNALIIPLYCGEDPGVISEDWFG